MKRFKLDLAGRDAIEVDEQLQSDMQRLAGKAREAIDQACAAAVIRGCGVRVATEMDYANNSVRTVATVDPDLPLGAIEYDPVGLRATGVDTPT